MHKKRAINNPDFTVLDNNLYHEIYLFDFIIQELLKINLTLISDEYKKMLFTENVTNSNKPMGMCLSWFSGQLNGSIIMFNRTGFTDERYLDKLDSFIIDEK